MSETGGLFNAAFIYTEEVLKDFEKLYIEKKEMSPAARIILGLMGGAGAIYFGYMIYKEGAQLTRIGYLMICSIMLVLALSRNSKRPDETIAKYRKYYLDRHATVKVDEEGIELKIEGQKNYARSKFREIYGLFDTDRCLYCVIKGKAYYIIPRDGIADGKADELKKYLEKKCSKRFQHYALDKQA